MMQMKLTFRQAWVVLTLDGAHRSMYFAEFQELGVKIKRAALSKVLRELRDKELIRFADRPGRAIYTLTVRGKHAACCLRTKQEVPASPKMWVLAKEYLEVDV